LTFKTVSHCVELSEIEKNDFNLNISRYVSAAKPEEVIDLVEVNRALAESDCKVSSLNALVKAVYFLVILDTKIVKI
jgi:type I restriction-modification system DNA methylase subunit